MIEPAGRHANSTAVELAKRGTRLPSFCVWISPSSEDLFGWRSHLLKNVVCCLNYFCTCPLICIKMDLELLLYLLAQSHTHDMEYEKIIKNTEIYVVP